MNFSAATMFVLVNGIAALPWSLGGTSKHSDALAADEDITLHIKVSQTQMHKTPPESSEFDICLKVCWQETPTCPTGWYSNNMGTRDHPCWTCCKAPSNDL
ncbi:hypothetical protein BKA56DRAFT_674073 [Ilyonectria sp. MPI-CAGE-AT-0026]|nr:hypothetical protein BKA56DRAFT_674073 [Ilyonectria sp. MPI-CAGE-AT-0026]